MELTPFIKKCSELGIDFKQKQVGNLEVTELFQETIIVALGGLGKTQFGVQSQHLIDRLDDLGAVFCVGASGGLASKMVLGDVVVATETIEHDIKKYSRTLMPRFQSDPRILEQFRTLPNGSRKFSVHFGPIASGDEDIMTIKRRQELNEQTGAIAVAWEGAGGARASRFSKLPFLEIRGISDSADQKAESDFSNNLGMVMGNLAEFIINWALCSKNISG